MKIIEYKTATAENCASLDAAVNKLIAQGFQIYGSPYSSHSNEDGIAGTFQVAQAMVRNGLQENPAPQPILPQTSVDP
jgi:hypothetical protein